MSTGGDVHFTGAVLCLAGTCQLVYLAATLVLGPTQ